MLHGDYSKNDMIHCLRDSGIEQGDTVYSHVGLRSFGIPCEASDGLNSFDVVNGAMREVISPSGTFMTPTFTYSFCNGEVYDPLTAPSTIGPFGNRFLKQENVIRSLDPIFSVAGIGPKAERFLSNIPNNSFGYDCLYDRLGNSTAKICHLGVTLFYSTCIHHLEQVLGASHRYLKVFSGHILLEGSLKKITWLYYVRILDDFSLPRFDRLHDEVLRNKLCTKIKLGGGYIYTISVKDLYATAREMLSDNLQCFAENPHYRPKHFLTPPPPTELPRNATLENMLKTLYSLPRDLISDGFNKALALIATQVPMKIHEYLPGTQCYTWIVPEKWSCREAYVATIKGEQLFSYRDHPLHVMSYSLPIDTVVSREELFKHLYVHDKLEHAIPFKFKYYERDWGFCCSKSIKQSLSDDSYHVFADTLFSYDSMKVGEVVATGVSDECYILCAHLCHPAQLNDDLSGVCAGIEVLRNLLARQTLNYTYRLLILPETIGSAAWISHNEAIIQQTRGGIFLEMLARNHPHALQLSLQGDSQLDKIALNVLQKHDPSFWHDRFMRVVLNDERMFNSPGTDVPMISLSRSLPKSHPDYPFAEYHTNLDNFENADINSVKISVNLTLKIIEAIEANFTPIRNYKGELFCSRFANIDYTGMSEYIHSVPYLIDNKRTIIDIACELNRDFFEVKSFIDILLLENLVSSRLPR